jgi:hypothetical protein
MEFSFSLVPGRTEEDRDTSKSRSLSRFEPRIEI